MAPPTSREEPIPDARAHTRDGLRVTVQTLREWNDRPVPLLTTWLIRSLAAAVVLLAGVLLVAAVSNPGTRPLLDQPPLRTGTPVDISRIVSHNLLVLALHGFACVAGFIAGSQIPIQAEARTGWRRTAHHRAARGAIVLVATLTIGSLTVQAVTIGRSAAAVAAALHTSPATLLLALLPHALPELAALFLPLAAWITAARRGDWDQLLAATAVTVAIAIPVLLACATWEVFGAPHLVAALTG
jgi:hypothetical protein